MKETELYYLLALQKVEGIGNILAKKLLDHLETAESIFRAKSTILNSIDGIGSTVIQNLKDKTIFEKAEKELQFIQQKQFKTLYYKNKDYPNKLKHCNDGPILIFSRGNLKINENKIISIVGTRQITSYGTEFCKKLIAELVPYNPIIVSGFAYGTDILAHQTAIENKLQTIAVLAHGLNQTYPKVHSKYQKNLEENGGFLTEFWSDCNPEKENFVKRNRIVAGISEATIVIESAEKGGSLITANLANDYNRDVLAVPGRITDKYSQGCNNLIKTQKAHLITSANDLIYTLNWELEKEKNAKSIQKKLFITLEPTEQIVYDFLSKNGKEQMDNLAISCNLPIYKLSSILLNLELKGQIRPLPGKIFEAI